MDFDEIWSFIEFKLQTPVPPYIKYILMFCGYNNGISISTIEDVDVQHFVDVVKNGSVTDYFGEKNILQGSMRSIDNFEFSRGHVKFLMYIVSFLREYIEENGHSFSMEISTNSGIKRQVQKTLFPLRKRFKRQHTFDHSKENFEDSIKQEDILLNKAIMTVVTYAPKNYVKNFKLISNRIAAAKLVTVEMNKTVHGLTRYAARICCPFCSEIVNVSHSFEQHSNKRSSEWNISNFDAHVKIHENNVNCEDEENFGNFNTFANVDAALNEHLFAGERYGLETEVDEPALSGMLKMFVDSAKRNFPKKKQGYRHDTTTKMFAAYIKMIAGLLAYETLHTNFPLCLPSESTVNRFIADNGPEIIEGEMRTDALLKYLKSRNLPLMVSLSEDATRITAKISYDPNTNQLIGFALPLDVNGMPIKFSFPARNVSEIQKHFLNSSNFISSTAYVQMAQPIDPNSSPFCLMLFLTDSTFTANNIFKRWKFQAGKLRENGIRIYNMSTDGDSRPLKVQKCLSRIGISDPEFLDCEWYSCGGSVETTFTQDVPHIIGKLRNRKLNFSRIFPFGNKIISASFLKYLIEHVSKDKHLLNRSDIEPKDRQNFLSAQKICSEKTMQCLTDYVPGCEGTVLYLKAMNNILTAFLNINITSEERVFLMWYAVFFFRAWRSWILNSEKLTTQRKGKPKSFYNLKENFISSNCYTCIELNAHALVKKILMENFDEQVKNKVFFPNLYSSQPCESTFRQVRSFTSTFSTVVNCNMLDIIHRMKKIQLQNDIINNSNGEINFPRFENKIKSKESSHRFESLTRTKIIIEIEKARKAVISDIEKLGIDSSKLNFHCQVTPVHEQDIMDIDSDTDSEWDSDDDEIALREECFEADYIEIDPERETQENIYSLSGITGELTLKDYRENHPEGEGNTLLSEKSPFVVVVDNKGKEMVVRKSSVCWLLSKDKFKLSSDRLQRVQEKEYTNNLGSSKVLCADNYTRSSEITVGDWCIFSENDVEEDPKVLVGLVLGFCYLNGKTFRDREFSKSSASVESSVESPVESSVESKLDRSIGVLSTFYTYNRVGELLSVPEDKHKHIKIESYIGTIKHPSYANKTLTISEKLAVELRKLMHCE